VKFRTRPPCRLSTILLYSEWHKIQPAGFAAGRFNPFSTAAIRCAPPARPGRGRARSG
jgi:hypothetical protein